MSQSAEPRGTYALISLGCPKNLVDSEQMAGLLKLEGYRLAAEPAGADFVVINTCGFIGDAREESFGVIREMLELKRQGLIEDRLAACEKDCRTPLLGRPGQRVGL